MYSGVIRKGVRRMTEQDKVTVDDIIGIVKTEEQTNSVEEVRKLRGRENKTAKRYFKRMWEEEYYIFDSNTISESDFEEKLEYQNYKAFEDSMLGDEVVNRLNEQHEQIQELQSELNKIKHFKCIMCGLTLGITIRNRLK